MEQSDPNLSSHCIQIAQQLVSSAVDLIGEFPSQTNCFNLDDELTFTTHVELIYDMLTVLHVCYLSFIYSSQKIYPATTINAWECTSAIVYFTSYTQHWASIAFFMAPKHVTTTCWWICQLLYKRNAQEGIYDTSSHTSDKLKKKNPSSIPARFAILEFEQ